MFKYSKVQKLSKVRLDIDVNSSITLGELKEFVQKCEEIVASELSEEEKQLVRINVEIGFDSCNNDECNAQYQAFQGMYLQIPINN